LNPWPDRYSGFYWQRGNTGSIQRIAYEVTDERDVENLTLVNPVAMAHKFYSASGYTGKLREARTKTIMESAYPSAGSTNPTTELRFLEIDLEQKFSNRHVTDYKLRLPIKQVRLIRKNRPYIFQPKFSRKSRIFELSKF